LATTFSDSLTRIRRKLRDPDGNIWSDQLLRHYWNDVQRDVLRKLPELLCRWESQPFPQFIMHQSYFQDWEYRYTRTTAENYAALEYWQEGRMVIAYPWEASYDETTSIKDDGYRNTLFWEAGQKKCGEPARVFLDRQFHEAQVVTYDEYTLGAITENEVAVDRFYKTNIGRSIYYYRPDDYSNTLILYPRPTSIEFNEPSRTGNDANDYATTSGWEINGYYITGASYMAQYSNEETPDGIWGTYGWEYDNHLAYDRHYSSETINPSPAATQEFGFASDGNQNDVAQKISGVLGKTINDVLISISSIGTAISQAVTFTIQYDDSGPDGTAQYTQSIAASVFAATGTRAFSITTPYTFTEDDAWLVFDSSATETGRADLATLDPATGGILAVRTVSIPTWADSTAGMYMVLGFVNSVSFGYTNPDHGWVLGFVNDTSESTTNTDYMTIIYRFSADDLPEEDAAWGENLPYPDWAVKYLEPMVLERAYGADTDGYIPSLRDYWALRYKVGIKVLRKFINATVTSDRRFVMGQSVKQRSQRHPTLPTAYPRVYP